MSATGKSITCRAAVAWKANEKLSIETVEVAAPKEGEVRVRMVSAGICRTDEHFLEAIHHKDYPFPSVLGHEGAGIIESVGKGVINLKPGDRVVLCCEGYCGKCDYCKDPRTNHCLNQPRNHLQKDGTSRITCKGQQLSQVLILGTFSEYTVTRETNVTKVNSKANLNALAPVGCCIPTGYGAAMNNARVSKGATCAIWGLGSVGMCVVMGCRDSGASKIIGLDTNPRKFDLAKQLGCTDVLNPTDIADVCKALSKMTNGGVDICFVTVGKIPAMEQAFKSSHPAWGKTIIIGECELGDSIRAEVWDLLFGRQLIGSLVGGYNLKKDIPGLVDKVVSGQIQLEKLVSHTVPLDKINEGFNMLKTGESLKTIINFDLKS